MTSTHDARSADRTSHRVRESRRRRARSDHTDDDLVTASATSEPATTVDATTTVAPTPESEPIITGRTPSPWVQGQIDWQNCIEAGNTQEYCRATVN